MKIILLFNVMFGATLAALAAFVFFHNGYVWEPVEVIRWSEFGLSMALSVYFAIQIPFFIIWLVRD